MWKTEYLTSIDQTFSKLDELFEDQFYIDKPEEARRRWITRGNSIIVNTLTPSIDRGHLIMRRSDRIDKERQSIEMFRNLTYPVLNTVERDLLTRDITTMMLMQHHCVPTRLLDWSLSPYVSAYFAVSEDDDKDGELWAFDYYRYVKMASKQWDVYPETKDSDGKFDNDLTVVFRREYKNRWFVCQFCYEQFPRYFNQAGAFSFFSQFGEDHAPFLEHLLNGDEYYCRYEIKNYLKKEIRKILFDKYGICQASLFPNLYGSTEYVVKKVKSDYGISPY